MRRSASHNMWIAGAITSILVGCRAPTSIVPHEERYENGQLKVDALIYEHGGAHHEYRASYYQNGDLQLLECLVGGGELHRLEFYPKGQLKAEEQFLNGNVIFRRTYSAS